MLTGRWCSIPDRDVRDEDSPVSSYVSVGRRTVRGRGRSREGGEVETSPGQTSVDTLPPTSSEGLPRVPPVPTLGTRLRRTGLSVQE